MGHARRFTKSDYIRVMMGTLGAVPDFNWSAASTGDVADDGFCVVVVNVSNGVGEGGKMGGGELFIEVDR
jgi:hypothetical protein